VNSTQARADLAAALATQVAASTAVDQAREDAADDPRRSSSVVKAQRRLAAASEKTEQLRATVRVAERREAVEQAHIQAEAERIGRELRKLAEQKRATELLKWRAFLEATLDQATEFDARLRGLRDQIKDLDAGQFPSRWSSWPLLATFVNDQLKHCPTPREA
jgi:hypothetical protein